MADQSKFIRVSGDERTARMKLRESWRNLIVILGVFALAFIPRAVGLGKFWATDERYHWELSNDFLMALLRGDLAGTVPQGLPGLTLAWVESIGVLVRYAVAWLASGGQASLEQIMAVDRPFAQLAQRQMVVVLVNALIVVGIFLLAQRVFGRKAALIAAIFVALDPFFLAESRVLRFEGLVAGLMTLSVLAVLVYVKEQRAYALILSAVMAGLAALSKISAVLLVIPVGLILLALLPDWRRDVSLRAVWRVGLAFALWCLIAALTFWAVWPAMWVSPLSTLQTVFEFSYKASEEGLEGRGVFFWGQIYPSDPGPWFYPVTFLFRITPLVLLGALAAIFVIVKDRRQGLERSSAGYWTWWGIVALLIYSFFFAFAMTLGAKKYDRYLMPVFPAFAVVAGVALNRIIDLAGVSSTSIEQGAAGGGSKIWVSSRWYLAFTILLGLQVATAAPHLPYYYTYFNPLLGGVKQASKVMPVGYGEGLDVAAQCLESKPNAADLSLASGNSGKLHGLFSGETIPLDNLDGRWVQGDYVMLYNSQLQRGRHRQSIVDYVQRQSPVCVVTLHGLAYARIYPGPAAQYHSGTKLEGRATLYGYSLSVPELSAGETLTVTVYFINEGQLPSDRFYVRLVDAGGYVWAQDAVRPRSGFEDAFSTREAMVEGEAKLTLPAGMPPGAYVLKMGYERAEGGQPIGEFVLPADGDDVIVKLPRVFPPVAEVQPDVPLDLVVKEELRLMAYELDTDQLTPGGSMWLTLDWYALSDVRHDYVEALQLLDEGGTEVAYWLGRPVRSGYPTDQWQAHQIVRDPWRLELPSEVSPGEYTLRLTLFDAETQAKVGEVALAEMSVVERERHYDIPDYQKAVNDDLGDQVKLLGYDLLAEPITGGGRFQVTLYWQAREKMESSYKVFVHLLSLDGEVLAQHDSVPADGEIPTTDWAVGEVIPDRHQIEFLGLPAGKYRLVVGMYDSTTGERLLASEGKTSILLNTLSVK
jgi:hypothetical protein